VSLTLGRDGALWFADEGQTPAIGRLSIGKARPTLREYSAGLLSGSLPAQITLGPSGRLWFTDEGSTTALGFVVTNAQRGPLVRLARWRLVA
jgi:streptogramin lyase